MVPQLPLQTEHPHVISADLVGGTVKNERLQPGQTTDFWGVQHFDFSDALNEEIWLLSSELQQQVQPIDSLKQPGVIGSQQAMLDGSLFAERGSLPWVPDLVGKQWRGHDSLVVVGSAYAGFIREYSTRTATMPLSQ